MLPNNSGREARQVSDANSDKYKLVFSINVFFGEFVDQLNQASRPGYRVKAVSFNWQRISGKLYNAQVAILERDEGEYEYGWFETSTRLFFAIPGFEAKYAEQSKRGFSLADHFFSGSSCDDTDPDSLIPTPNCAASYLFLLEREKGHQKPTQYVVAETGPGWQKKLDETLTSQIQAKLADGFYPTDVFSSYQILLRRIEQKDEPPTTRLEVQVVTSSFRHDVKEKVNELAQRGYRLALIHNEAAVVYRQTDTVTPITYTWLNAKKKGFEKELPKLQASGAIFRMVYRDGDGGNQLVFEQKMVDDNRPREYRVLKFEFQNLENVSLKHGGTGKANFGLTPAAIEAVKLLNSLGNEGYVVRALFVSDFVSKNVSALLERSP